MVSALKLVRAVAHSFNYSCGVDYSITVLSIVTRS